MGTKAFTTVGGILLSILLFAAMTFVSSIAIERLYYSRWRISLIIGLAAFFLLLFLNIGFVAEITKTLVDGVSLTALAAVLAGGVVSGLFISGV